MKRKGYEVAALVLALITLALVAYLPVSGAQATPKSSLSPWGATGVYPYPVYGLSCATNSNYSYCVGGFMAGVYYARLTSAGIKGAYTNVATGASSTDIPSWIPTAGYPLPIGFLSCVSGSGRMYCIGGRTSSGYTTNAVYAATLASSGIDSWVATTSYPIPVASESCVASSGYIYCVGGYTSATYYAPILGNGSLGQWKATTSFPTSAANQSCVVYSGYIYCIGGGVNYFAPLSSAGIGTWQSTTSYPFYVQAESCVPSSGYVYCVGGQIVPTLSYLNSTFSAPLSAAGIGGWRNATNYPLAVAFESCVPGSGYIFCVGGASPTGQGGQAQNVNSVYYALPASLATSTATSTVVSTSLVTSNKTLTSTQVVTSIQTTTLFHNSTETSTATETITSSVTQPASTEIVTQTTESSAPRILVQAKSSNGTALGGIRVNLTGSLGFEASLRTNSSGYVVFAGMTEGKTYTVAARIEGTILSTAVPAKGNVFVILEPTQASLSHGSPVSGITTQEAALLALPVAVGLVVVFVALRRSRRGVKSL